MVREEEREPDTVFILRQNGEREERDGARNERK